MPISAEEWRQIVDSAIDTAIISTDRHGRVTSWSKGAERILGWSEAEMLGKTLERLFPADAGAAALNKEMADAAATGRGGGEEGLRCRRDGSYFWATGEMTPIRDGEGVPVGFTKVLRDRTAYRAAEEAVREERRALEVLNRAGSALAIEKELNRLVQVVTDAGVELIGAEFGAFFYNILDDRGESYTLYTLSGAPMERFSNFPMPRKTELFASTFDGSGIVRSDDITRDPRYGRNAPYAGMPEGHLPVRSYLAVPVASRSGDVIGGLFFGHSEPGKFSERSERGLAGLAAEAAIAIDNFRLVQALQAEVAERKRAERALRDLNATLEEQIAERTEQLRMNEEALRQSQKMEAIGRLTGGIAHDFNNLLTIISSSAALLRRPDLPDERRLRYIDAIADTAERAAKVTGQLLAFARRQPLRPEVFDACEQVERIAELLRPMLGNRVRIELERPERPCYVDTDRAQFETALVNLAINARDAMAGGGQLTLSVRCADRIPAHDGQEEIAADVVAVSVRDTGSGIAAEQIDRIFEPFYTTKGVGKGTGLGLSQVIGFVKQTGGEVLVESEPGMGATFTLYLPRSRAGPSAAVARRLDAMPGAPKNARVLVVEDDEDVGSFSTQMLEDLGYATGLARGAGEALAMLEAAPDAYDLVFSDVMMPEMDGIELVRRVRALYPAMPVILTSGYSEMLAEIGVPDVPLLAKPYSIEALAGALRDAIGGAIEQAAAM